MYLDASGSTDTDGSITLYTWNFGDGSGEVSGTKPTVSHQYTTGGTFLITLTVTDNTGLWSSTIQNLNVQTIGTPSNPGNDTPAPTNTTATPTSTLTVNATGTPVISGNVSMTVNTTIAPYPDTSLQPPQMPVGTLMLAAGLLLPVILVGGVLYLRRRSGVKLVVTDRRAPADGVSTIPIHIQLVNGFGHAHKMKEDTPVELRATSGTVQDVIIPTGEDSASTTLTTSRECGTVTITADVEGRTAEEQVEFVCDNASLEMTANPMEIPADGHSTATIIIRITDESGEDITFLDEKTLELTTDLGTIPKTLQIAPKAHDRSTTITSTSDKEGGTATIEAFMGPLRGRTQVRFRSLTKRHCMHCGSLMAMDMARCPNSACGLIPPEGGTHVIRCANPTCGRDLPDSAKFCDICGVGQPQQ